MDQTARSSRPSPAARARRLVRLREYLPGLVTAAEARGELRAGVDAGRLAGLALAVMQGTLMNALVDGEGEPTGRALAALDALLAPYLFAARHR